MYIEPGTNIRLLKDVPLDTTYDHTIYFSSASAQSTYFMGLQKYNLTNYAYQRVKKGVARVGIKADNLYDCNYMMFQNTSYGNKWFYAFITAVEFVNNECSEVYFELDVMQTWFFDCEPDYCFVEREHALVDDIGMNITPETLATGEYVFNDYEAITGMRDMVVCIAIVDTNDATDGTLYDGIYGSAQLWVYDSTDVQGINDKVNDYVQKPDAIIGMYMFPKIFIGGSIPDTHRLSYGAGATKTTVKLSKITNNDTIDGYKPKNAKLYTYPYNFYHVDNASGSELSLRYEFFDNLTPVVEISGTVTQPVIACLRPCSYKGVAGYSELGGYTTLNTESLQLNSYPMCSWNVDAYQAWVAQNSVPIALNTIASVGQMGIAGAYSTNPNAVIGAGVIGQVSNITGQFYQASIAADISKGNLNNGGANVANGKQQFYGGRCSVKEEYARIIDDYFTMFGYATRRCKKPNRNSRPHWNYVKTIGCTITGSVPADDLKKICSIYDNGITFWKNGSEVGNYNLDNTV
jgi:hypothetical protein|nr:MAG TPA: Major tail protein [Caudoviricetes sp.]